MRRSGIFARARVGCLYVDYLFELGAGRGGVRWGQTSLDQDKLREAGQPTLPLVSESNIIVTLPHHKLVPYVTQSRLLYMWVARRLQASSLALSSCSIIPARVQSNPGPERKKYIHVSVPPTTATYQHPFANGELPKKYMPNAGDMHRNLHSTPHRDRMPRSSPKRRTHARNRGYR